MGRPTADSLQSLAARVDGSENSFLARTEGSLATSETSPWHGAVASLRERQIAQFGFKIGARRGAIADIYTRGAGSPGIRVRSREAKNCPFRKARQPQKHRSR